MALITLATLKQQLSLLNVEYDLTDTDLELLLNNLIIELTGYIGVPINEENKKDIVNSFSGKLYEVDYYPVKEITSFQIGSTTLSDEDYVLDDSQGILYLHSEMKGLLVIEYVTCLPDNVINQKINPLLVDMIRYRLTNNFNTEGVVSSVKEMDVSVNYDTSSSLGNLIQSRINDLKNSYSIKIKVV